MQYPDLRLLVVSNRLPVVVSRDDGNWLVQPASGGLVTALAPLMKKNRGLWVGWPGCGPEAPARRLVKQSGEEQGFDLEPVIMTEIEVERYYRGFSNGTLWPLFHDLLGHCRFARSDWEMYVDVNRRFAEVVARSAAPKSVIWVHDYQLLLVGRHLKRMGLKQRLNFFLHIPFPSQDLFRRLPWRQELIEAMLEFDHLGFQTSADRRNFVQCVKSLMPEARVKSHKREAVVKHDGREILLGFYPISIDFNEFNSDAQATEVADAAWYLRENLPGRQLVLGLDRLDYTKGIPERFLAFERMLEKFPETLGNISLVQVLVPSRLHVPEYQSLKEQLDQLVGRINSRFSRHGWVPIHYLFRHLDRTQLLGHYRACDIALITPLRDGMNLVAKEYCAASVDRNGVLILSEFAGAAAQLAKAALMVNPYDLEGTADAIYRAYLMGPEERRRRLRILRSEVRRNDVHKWVRAFLGSEIPSRGPSVGDSLLMF